MACGQLRIAGTAELGDCLSGHGFHGYDLGMQAATANVPFWHAQRLAVVPFPARVKLHGQMCGVTGTGTARMWFAALCPYTLPPGVRNALNAGFGRRIRA